ncbi:hypothetical protein FKW77_007718 [Venturia effusa]|uniref:Uncharacterized protein n=1 Tax=Venturia effusa TaxID=50376 RepID=A0A517LJ63_9PEZI|nr:hypothetical protein FKW77_007718 [Venturia effusa]
MDGSPDHLLISLQIELEELHLAHAYLEKEVEDLRSKKDAYTQEKQAWENEKEAWEAERESFATEKQTWQAERQARALEKEFEEHYQALHSHFMQMIQGINDVTAGIVEGDIQVEDAHDSAEEVNERMASQPADEQDQQGSEKEKCKLIIGNVRRVGKQWLNCVEAAVEADQDFVFRADDVQARLDAVADLLEMMEDSGEPISEL